MLFFNISSLNSKITWYDPNLVPITLHWSKWPFHTRARKSILLYSKCQGRGATYNLWQSKHYLQMKSPVTRAPRQFLHDGSCLCLWLWWGIFFVVVAVSHRPPLDFRGISQFHWPWCIPSRWVSGSHRKPSTSPDLVSNKGSHRFPHDWLIGCHCYPQACLPG